MQTSVFKRKDVCSKILKLFYLNDFSRCLAYSRNVQQLKLPNVRKRNKLTNDEKNRFDRENELLYGPVIKNCKGVKQKILNKNHDDIPAATKQPNLDESISENQTTPACPSVDATIHLDTDSGPTNVSASEPLTIPYGNVFHFPLKTGAASDASLRAATSELELDLTTTPSSASVTSILQRTMTPENVAALDRWRKQMIAKLGMQGFTKYQEDTFQTGAALHKNIHNFLKGEPTSESQMDSRILGHWKSILPVLEEITDVVLLEKKVTHPYLRYHGIADCIARHRNKLVMVEWKTSQKPKPLLRHTYDNPLQVAAYMGAFNAVTPEQSQLDSGIIVICYPDGTPAHTHIMDPGISQKVWESWLLKLRQFWQFQKQANQGTTDSGSI